ncbi:hypothetical protein [Williamsoniiplasma lucivorax]|uniref:Uncharacterized protein n=1 Tax=Williamsoniiplasma lucivorax TaxID=209274 RepID=A0A2S5RG10_9MOLU|nr:hypothetical protein [Williamsoniiplasma lucivorax]PPE06152.1 hypothetical protein ELUCI_v1c04430 [Williamsoniiplasma lucivorax]
MFNNLLSSTNAAILLIYFICSASGLVYVIVGKFFLLIKAKKTMTLFSAQDVLNEEFLAKNELIFHQKKIFFNCWTNFWKPKIIWIKPKNLASENLWIISHLASNLNTANNSILENRINRWQFWGIYFLTLVWIATLIGSILLLLLSPMTDTMAQGRLSWGVQTGLQALAILGWFIQVIIFVWWINLNGTRNDKIIMEMKKHLPQEDLGKLTFFLKIQSYIPFSINPIV